MTALRPEALLEHAAELASHPPGAGRPRSTWLRRSTSASYYAVFHAISLAVVRQIAPQATVDEQYRLVRRLRGNPDLKQLAWTFLRLQQARHDADYDHLTSPRKSMSSTHHAEATRALALVRRLAVTSDGQAFLAVVALRTSAAA